MRALFLCRQTEGSLAWVARGLASSLERFGVSCDLDASAGWMPRQTDPKTVRGVNKELKQLARDYDVVHAFGYREAWACGEALGLRKPWFYTAVDPPKVESQLLCERLNPARAGLCASAGVRRALDRMDVPNLRLMRPGVEPVDHSRGELVVGVGRFVPERGFDKLIEAAHHLPGTEIRLFGEGPEEDSLRSFAKGLDNVRIDRFPRPIAKAFEGAGLVVVPARAIGFSASLASAMAGGVPGLVRRSPALVEQVADGVDGFVYDTVEDIPTTVESAFRDEERLERISAAAKSRARRDHDVTRYAQRVRDAYEEALE